jgi:hypothetical protein
LDAAILMKAAEDRVDHRLDRRELGGAASGLFGRHRHAADSAASPKMKGGDSLRSGAEHVVRVA